MLAYVKDGESGGGSSAVARGRIVAFVSLIVLGLTVAGVAVVDTAAEISRSPRPDALPGSSSAFGATPPFINSGSPAVGEDPFDRGQRQSESREAARLDALTDTEAATVRIFDKRSGYTFIVWHDDQGSICAGATEEDDPLGSPIINCVTAAAFAVDGVQVAVARSPTDLGPSFVLMPVDPSPATG